jgi:hypothetical protein
MDDMQLKQTIRDGAAYSEDARSICRFRLTDDKLRAVRDRLVGARASIDRAISEIDSRIGCLRRLQKENDHWSEVK